MKRRAGRLGGGLVCLRMLQPEVAEFARVCAYDRAGVGWSDPRLGPRTSRVMAQELRTLLGNAGMALVDSSHPDQPRRIPEFERSCECRRRQIERERLLMPVGIPRLLGWCGNWYGTAMSGMQAALRSFDCTVRQKQGTLAEMAGSSESFAQAGATGSLGDLPLIVVSEAPSCPGATWVSAIWYPMQDELALLSSRGARVNAQGSGHVIALDRPDAAIAAIRDVVFRCRRQ